MSKPQVDPSIRLHGEFHYIYTFMSGFVAFPNEPYSIRLCAEVYYM